MIYEIVYSEAIDNGCLMLQTILYKSVTRAVYEKKKSEVSRRSIFIKGQREDGKFLLSRNKRCLATGRYVN